MGELRRKIVCFFTDRVKQLFTDKTRVAAGIDRVNRLIFNSGTDLSKKYFGVRGSKFRIEFLFRSNVFNHTNKLNWSIVFYPYALIVPFSIYYSFCFQ